MTTNGLPAARFAEILAKARLAKSIQLTLPFPPIPVSDSEPTFTLVSKSEPTTTTDKYGNSITYNHKQQAFIDLASTMQSCCLIGAAGTGKTTCMKGTIEVLEQHPSTGILQNHDHSHLPHGVPGIVVCAYTRRATNNIRRNMPANMKANCITIHKLLEYGPEYFDIVNENGDTKRSMQFAPQRTKDNPLPSEITTVVFEESSMIGTSLYAEFLDALSHDVQIIFLGDIQQLPPVFGPAILGFKLNELPTIELVDVYRQALESPIIRLAHRILSGVPIPPAELDSWNCPGLTIKPWKKKIDAEDALTVTEKLFEKLYDEGNYDPEQDMILIPFNKAYGTIDINKTIANKLATKQSRVVWEVMAGFIKHYLAVGDKVLYDREDAIILDIFPNPTYLGKPTQKESIYLDYWGHNNTPRELTTTPDQEVSDQDIDFLLESVISDSDDRVTQSSHHIKLFLQDSETNKTITKAAEVNAILLGYALTVHKAQGSEWDKVFLLLHNSHATMLQRELLYTGVTRAKKELIVICEKDTFTSAIKSQRIKGNTLAEKAEYFKGRMSEMQS